MNSMISVPGTVATVNNNKNKKIKKDQNESQLRAQLALQKDIIQSLSQVQAIGKLNYLIIFKKCTNEFYAFYSIKIIFLIVPSNAVPEQVKSHVSTVQKSQLPTITVQSHVSVTQTSQSPSVTVQSQIPIAQYSQVSIMGNTTNLSTTMAPLDFNLPNNSLQNSGNKYTEALSSVEENYSSKENPSSKEVINQ